MGGVGSLALVGGYPSDGVTKKILVVVSPKTLSSQESNMDYPNIVNNGVNETGTEGEGLSPGRCLMAPSSMSPVVIKLLLGGLGESGHRMITGLLWNVIIAASQVAATRRIK